MGAWPLLAVMLLFLFLTARVFTQHTIHVLLVEQQLAHLIARTSVFGIRRLFLRQQLGVFLLQALDGGQLFDAQLVKGFLRRLVQQDVALMISKIQTDTSGWQKPVRTAQLVCGSKTDLLFVADSGPGETNTKGLTVLWFGYEAAAHLFLRKC